MRNQILNFFVMATVGFFLGLPIYIVLAASNCPHTTTESIPCPTSEESKECKGNVITCPLSSWLTIESGNFESKANPGEETKTQTAVEDKDKVTCYSDGACIFVPAVPLISNAKCKPNELIIVLPKKVNPLKEVPC